MTAEPLVDAPQFTGVWADLLTDAYRNAHTDAQRRILADGVVTDTEYAQVQNEFKACMADIGIAVTFEKHGRMSSVSSDTAPVGTAFEEAVVGCFNRTSTGVDWVYETMKRNPENLDEATIMTDCLIRVGLLPQGYSAGQYPHDWENGTLPFSELDQLAVECQDDPLGLSS